MRKDLDALHDAWAKLAKDVKKKKNSSKISEKTVKQKISQEKPTETEEITKTAN